MSDDPDRALARCLDDLENNRDTLEGCLGRYPALADSLAPALRTALALRALPPVRPAPSFRAVARTRLLNMIAARQTSSRSQRVMAPAPMPRRRLAWASLAWALAAVLLVLSLLGGGAVVAAAETLPDHPLYPIKLATERAQITLTPAEEKRFELYLQQADRRLAEATAMALAGKAERSAQALAAYQNLLQEMEKAVTIASARGRNVAALTDRFQDHVNRQSQILHRVYRQAPPRARPALLHIAESATEAQGKVLDKMEKPRPPQKPLRPGK